jgi:hypothetical protein
MQTLTNSHRRFVLQEHLREFVLQGKGDAAHSPDQESRMGPITN